MQLSPIRRAATATALTMAVAAVGVAGACAKAPDSVSAERTAEAPSDTSSSGGGAGSAPAATSAPGTTRTSGTTRRPGTTSTSRELGDEDLAALLPTAADLPGDGWKVTRGPESKPTAVASTSDSNTVGSVVPSDVCDEWVTGEAALAAGEEFPGARVILKHEGNLSLEVILIQMPDADAASGAFVALSNGGFGDCVIKAGSVTALTPVTSEGLGAIGDERAMWLVEGMSSDHGERTYLAFAVVENLLLAVGISTTGEPDAIDLLAVAVERAQ